MSLTLAEQLLYSTVKLTSLQNGVPQSTGTGFFMIFNAGDDLHIPLLFTNKHVIVGSNEINAICHVKQDEKPSGRFISITIATGGNLVINHPENNVDLCAIAIGPALNTAREQGIEIFFMPFTSDLIPEHDEWEYFDAIEDVTMIGSPRGISDEVNNLPIIRRGITASALSKKYNGKDEFMVDMACFPGSSGSPILLYDRNGYFNRKENVYMMGVSRVKLVGVLYSGPLVTNRGQIVLGQSTDVVVSSMMHLGNAIRSSQILPIVELARAIAAQQSS